MFRVLTLLALLALPLTPGQTQAAPSQMAEVELLPGWRTAEGTHMAALRVRLAEGWKTYWRAPGAAGLPPSFEWSGVKGVRLHWPVPEVVHQSGMTIVAYHDELVLPVEFLLNGPGTARVSARIEMGVCDDICVPLSLALTADLPTTSRRDPRIVAALLNQPARKGSARCVMSGTGNGVALEAHISAPDLGPSPHVVIESDDPRQWVDLQGLSRRGSALVARAHLGGGGAIDRSRLRLTVLGNGRAVEMIGCPAP